MPIVQSRRRFLTNLAFAGAAGLGGIGAALDGARKSFAAEPPQETTTVRIRFEGGPGPPCWSTGCPIPWPAMRL
jgi:hypothetical protein